MTGLLKILLPLVAVGAVATITFIAVPSGTTLVSLKDVANYKYPSSTSGIKFGALFSHFFLSTTHKENDTEWEARAKEIKTTSTVSSSFFSNLTIPVTGKKLKEKCKIVYNETGFTKTETLKSNTKWGEAWERCSLGKTTPVVINDLQTDNIEKKKTENSGEWTTKFGATKKEDILSLTYKNNEWIWAVLNKEMGTGYLASSTSQTETFFKKSDTDKTLKDLCAKAYNITSASSTHPTEAEVLKHCSLKRPQTN